MTGAYRAAFEGIRNYSLAATYGVLILSMLVVYASVYRRMLRRPGRGVLMAVTPLAPSRHRESAAAAPRARRTARSSPVCTAR